MDDAQFIAKAFDDIITRCDAHGRPTALPHVEQVVYYVVAVRCESDMNGFCSIFEQLLTHNELRLFIDILRELQSDDLADTYREIELLLDGVGFFREGGPEFHDLPEEVLKSFDALEQRARAGDPLWSLDRQLATLVRR